MSLITMASTACRRTALFPSFLSSSSSSSFRATSTVLAPTATSTHKSLFFSSLVNNSNNSNNHITTTTVTADSRSNTNSSNYQTSRHKYGTEIRRQYHPTYLVPQQGQEQDFKTTVPTLDVAQSMPVGMAEMSNEMLVTISAMGHHEAHCEVLKRHVMAVDQISYEDASIVYEEIATKNRTSFIRLAVYPYFIGIGAGMFAAFASLPMVFDLNVAVWFNDLYVTTDIPEPRDLETRLEVGAWTWNWMEPPLGTLSFSLLCLQYAR
eukprot:scaffold3234_cov56-Cylindrotheca_fusiformis.AAC.1